MTVELCEADLLLRNMLNKIEDWINNKNHNTFTMEQLLQLRTECINDLIKVQLANFNHG
jgi:hypothetical protein